MSIHTYLYSARRNRVCVYIGRHPDAPLPFPVDLNSLPFNHIWEREEGDVAISLIERGARKRSLVFHVRAGHCFSKETHWHPHLLTVLRGDGMFTFGESRIPYQEGSVFAVPGETPHAFARVDTDTYVFQEQWYENHA